MDKKKINLLLGGVKEKAWSVAFNGTNTVINGGSEASIDNLAAATITAECYVKTTDNEFGLFYKQSWHVRQSANFTRGKIQVVTPAYVDTGAVSNTDGFWHHWALTYNNLTDRKAYLWKDGVLVASSDAVAVDVIDDASSSLLIGNNNLNEYLSGYMGWFRVSNVIRYTTTFVPTSRFEYPVVDANTVRLFKMNEGTGTTIVDYSANAQNATLSNGTWIKQ